MRKHRALLSVAGCRVAAGLRSYWPKKRRQVLAPFVMLRLLFFDVMLTVCDQPVPGLAVDMFQEFLFCEWWRVFLLLACDHIRPEKDAVACVKPGEDPTIQPAKCIFQ